MKSDIIQELEQTKRENILEIFKKINDKDSNVNIKKINLSPVQVLAISFALVILIGALLLMLPISSQSGEYTPFVDSLFTSTSAVCVTGLVTVDTGTHWNYFGRTIIMILIQIGGLGFMTFSTITAVMLGKKITLKNRLLMQEAYNAFNLQGIIRMVKYVVTFTLCVEGIGALLLMTQFIPIDGLATGIYYGIFHSVSAFCNAGLDLIGNFQSVVPFNTNKVLLTTIMTLIATGGLGFAVWMEIFEFKKFKKMSLHSRLVIKTTLGLILGGALLIFLFEYSNPSTMQGMSFIDKVVNSIFSSITPRTAGFNSVSTSEMRIGSRMITMILMFIGGSPGSTAGGIKTTAFATLLFTVICVIKGREDTEISDRHLDKSTVYKAFTVVVMGVVIVTVGTVIISVFNPSFTLEQIVYEVISAFATVGLTEGITTSLHIVSKYTLITIMYLGRVGPLTVILALANLKMPAKLKYPEAKVLIG